MTTEFGQFIGFFVMVFLPVVFVYTLSGIANRFDAYDEEIRELKRRINEYENKKD